MTVDGGTAALGMVRPRIVQRRTVQRGVVAGFNLDRRHTSERDPGSGRTFARTQLSWPPRLDGDGLEPD
jgi:hypothetical protein